MHRDRLPRHVEVDWSRRKGDRLPILDARPSLDFGEPGVTDHEGRTIEGTIGWDPSLGWVLNIPPDPASDAPIDTDEGFE
jgi:hypothetical protein